MGLNKKAFPKEGKTGASSPKNGGIPWRKLGWIRRLHALANQRKHDSTEPQFRWNYNREGGKKLLNGKFCR